MQHTPRSSFWIDIDFFSYYLYILQVVFNSWKAPGLPVLRGRLRNSFFLYDTEQKFSVMGSTLLSVAVLVALLAFKALLQVNSLPWNKPLLLAQSVGTDLWVGTVQVSWHRDFSRCAAVIYTWKYKSGFGIKQGVVAGRNFRSTTETAESALNTVST